MSDYSMGPLQINILNCTRVPRADETGQLTPGVDYVVGENFLVKFSDKFYCCVDSNNVAALKFIEIGGAPAGWNLNSPRSFTTRSGAAFNTDYTPSATNDTLVIFPFSQASVALGSATANKTYRVNTATSGIGSSNAVGTIKELSL